MGFLSRFTKSASTGDPDPLAPFILEAIEHRGQIYTRGSCPSCSAPLEKLPARTGGKCAECGQVIVRVGHVDHLTYLTQEGADGPIRAEGDQHYQIFRAPWGKQSGYDPDSRRQFSARFLARYQRLGLRVVLDGSDNCCRVCAGLKRIHNPSEAPLLPFERCESYSRYCFCDWQPAVPD